MRVHKCPAFFLSELTKMENLKKFLLKIETKQMRITLTIQRLLIGAKKRRCMSMSKKRLLSIKMCGWWAHAAGYRSAEGCDIKYGDVAYKSSYQTKPAITNAINAVDGKKLVSSGGQLFFTSYFAGSSNTDGKNSGRLRQNGSNYLASTKSYTYTEILHYYYDNSSYNNPSVGIVKIN